MTNKFKQDVSIVIAKFLGYRIEVGPDRQHGRSPDLFEKSPSGVTGKVFRHAGEPEAYYLEDRIADAESVSFRTLFANPTWDDLMDIVVAKIEDTELVAPNGDKFYMSFAMDSKVVSFKNTTYGSPHQQFNIMTYRNQYDNSKQAVWSACYNFIKSYNAYLEP